MTEAAKGEGASLVARTARRLSEISMAAEEGAPLGSEEQLLELLAVSRPTLRQAAKLVEADQLISVRRGGKGGYYARRPDASYVISAPARFLRLNNAQFSDMQEVNRLLQPEAAAMAARCKDPDHIRAAHALHARLRDMPIGETPAEAIAEDTELDDLVARMSGNPVILLFSNIFYAFGRMEREFKFYRLPEDRRKGRELRVNLSHAIANADADLARLFSVRRLQAIDRWIS